MTSAGNIPSAGIFQRLSRFAELSRSERRLFLEAVAWLGLFRMVILTIPFRRIASHLGEHMAETSSHPESLEDRLLARSAAQAVKRASRHVPWEAKCLVQAMAGKKMLKRRGIETTLYLGLAKKADREGLQAHAWLRSGDKIILGGGGLKAFTVVSTFGEICHYQKKKWR